MLVLLRSRDEISRSVLILKHIAVATLHPERSAAPYIFIFTIHLVALETCSLRRTVIVRLVMTPYHIFPRLRVIQQLRTLNHTTPAQFLCSHPILDYLLLKLPVHQVATAVKIHIRSPDIRTIFSTHIPHPINKHESRGMSLHRIALSSEPHLSVPDCSPLPFRLVTSLRSGCHCHSPNNT